MGGTGTLNTVRVRRMPVPPFLVYYRVNDDTKTVDIVAVRHGARRQPRTFE